MKLNTRLNNAWATLAHHYQSRRDLANRAIPAIGLALLLEALLSARPTYPAEWHTFLLLVVACFGFYNAVAGFVAALALAAWPLWTLSPYLASLFFALAGLLHLVILRRLNWSLLITAAPLLAWNVMLALAPLLAGMLLGPAGGFWVGALAALWLKVAGGMGHLPTDLLTLHLQPIVLSDIAARFHEAGSLETLQLLVAPFSLGSRQLLLDILQVLGFGFAGALVGLIRQQNWAESRPWANLTVALFGGALVAWASIFVLPIWVGTATMMILIEDPYTTLGIFLCPIMALGLYSVRYLLTRSRQRPSSARSSSALTPPGASTPVPSSAPRKSGSTAGKAGEENGARDVIKLELD